MARKTSLAELRKEMSEVTLEIFRLCGERLELAKKIGETKARQNMPIEDLKIEEELRNEVLELCQACGMDSSFTVKLLVLLLDESKRVQKEAFNLEPRHINDGGPKT